MTLSQDSRQAVGEGAQPVGEDTRLSIILHEYDTLRNELIGKNALSAQIISQASTVFATLLAAILIAQQQKVLSDNGAVLISSLSLSGLILIFILSFFSLRYDTKKISKRLRAIEAYVNEKAGTKLLIWETDFGWGGLLPWGRR